MHTSAGPANGAGGPEIPPRVGREGRSAWNLAQAGGDADGAPGPCVAIQPPPWPGPMKGRAGLGLTTPA